MRDLINGTAIADDPYIREAALSPGLQVTRDTIRAWRAFRLDRNCRLTAALLKRRGGYDEVLASIARGPVSPYIEELSAAFLEAAAACDDAIVATVAKFETALLQDDDVERAVDWPCDPYAVLGPLLIGDDVPLVPAVPHRTIVSRAIRGCFRVESV